MADNMQITQEIFVETCTNSYSKVNEKRVFSQAIYPEFHSHVTHHPATSYLGAYNHKATGRA